MLQLNLCKAGIRYKLNKMEEKQKIKINKSGNAEINYKLKIIIKYIMQKII